MKKNNKNRTIKFMVNGYLGEKPYLINVANYVMRVGGVVILSSAISNGSNRAGFIAVIFVLLGTLFLFSTLEVEEREHLEIPKSQWG